MKRATFLQLLKVTGRRPGEAWQLTWTDIDTVTNTVRITPEKNSNPRIFKIPTKLSEMLTSLPKTYDNRIFSKPNQRLDNHSGNFRKQRKSIAHRLKNPRFLNITFKTFRHWKGTMEYHRTKDILHVMQLLGHRNIRNTLVYTHLVSFEGDEYICKIARNVDEASALVESGFEYVSEIDGVQLFRKRK